MTDFFAQLDSQHTQKHLPSLQTPLGERSVYDSVAFCNRCGSCQQVCPTYLLTAEETFSPRGRNQAIRLLIEGKLNLSRNRPLLKAMADSCLLCGRCTEACAGKIPTAEHILELRRTLQTKTLPPLLHKLLSWRNRRPKRFALCIRLGWMIRRLGVIRLLRALGITQLNALSWINHADDILPAPAAGLFKNPFWSTKTHAPEKPTFIYLPSLEAEFLMPDLGAVVLKQAAQKQHVLVWKNFSSGLFEYIYGDLRQSRRLLYRLIRRHQQTAGGKLPLLTDSIDVYLFLQKAPQLFSRWPKKKQQAQLFVQNLRFVTDILPKTPLRRIQSGRIRLDKSALFSCEGKPFETAEKILKTQFRKNFVECSYKNADTPAFGYSFVQRHLAHSIMMQNVQNIARTQTGTVFTLSGLSALELNFYLKRFYPTAKADHLVRLHG